MPSWDDVGAVLGAMPETSLDTGTDHPAWRVRGKVLARLNPSMRVPGEEETRRVRGVLISVWVGHGEREALIRMEPEVFFFTPHWESNPSVLVWLEWIDLTLLRELLIDAWRLRAPKRLLADWEAAR